MIVEESELYQKQKQYHDLLGWIAPILFFSFVFIITPIIAIFIMLRGKQE